MPRSAPRTLVVTDTVPGARSAGEVRLAALSGLLAESGPVDLVALDRDRDDPSDDRVADLRRQGVTVRPGHGIPALRAALAGRVYELVIAEFWHVAERALPVVAARQPQARTAVDTVDLHFVREDRAAALDPAWRDGWEDRKRRELATYASAGVRIFVSAEERDRAVEEGAASPGDPVVPIIASGSERGDGERDPVAVFVGNFWHGPNADAVTWLHDEIWPAVRERVPDATLVIAGTRIDDDLRARLAGPGIEVRGRVADLGALYDGAGAVLAPLRFGAGVKGKVVEALAAGAPMVVTPLATEGLELRSGRDVLIAADADDFAGAVARVLGDGGLGARLGRSGRDRVLARCHPDAVRPVVAALVGDRVGARSDDVRWWVRGLPESLWLAVRPAAVAVRRLSPGRRRGG